jgi:predicted amidohydrolase
MKIALCQLNTVMGDIAGNTAKVLETLKSLRSVHPDMLLFS